MKTFSIDGASGGSGWGVARVEFGTIALETTQTISIADLGITSVNDYFVLIAFTDTPDYSSRYFAPYNRTTQSFEITNDFDMDMNYIYMSSSSKATVAVLEVADNNKIAVFVTDKQKIKLAEKS